jgi:hypothetical protein
VASRSSRGLTGLKEVPVISTTGRGSSGRRSATTV